MFVCDGCGKERRSVAARQEVVIFGEVDDTFQFCFLCVKEAERDERRELDRRHENPTYS